MRTSVALCLILSVACAPEEEPVEVARDVHLAMPFDGESRYWEFLSTDPGTGWKLEAHMVGLDETITDQDVYVIEHRTNCVSSGIDCEEDAVIATYAWSSTEGAGVQLHSFMAGMTHIQFNPAMQVLTSDMLVGEGLNTDNGLQVWTSTLVGYERCPTRLPLEWSNECLHFQVTDGDSDPMTGAGLAGDYWVAEGQGIVGFQAEGEIGLWELDVHGCEPAESCDGTW